MLSVTRNKLKMETTFMANNIVTSYLVAITVTTAYNESPWLQPIQGTFPQRQRNNRGPLHRNSRINKHVTGDSTFPKQRIAEHGRLNPDE
jgi:hypothetical protein